MAIDFPASPSVNDTHTVGSTTWTWDGTKWTITSGAAGATDKIEEGNTSAEVIDTGSDGRFVVTTEGTEKLRINSNGNLGLGVVPSSSSVSGSTVEVNYAGSGIVATSPADTSFTNNSYYDAGWKHGTTNASARLQLSDNQFIFYNAPSGTAGNSLSFTERMRIGSDGTSYFQAPLNVVGAITQTSAGVSNRLYYGAHSGSGPAGTICYTVWTNGNVVNTNNSYGQLTSDERFKQDIVDANSQWDDIKNIRITNYRWKSDPTGPLLLGPIAQELQAVSPGLVDTRIAVKEDESASGGLVSEGDEVLSFKASILYMKAVKALQEAQLRIETLEAQNADILARLTALEGGTP